VKITNYFAIIIHLCKGGKIMYTYQITSTTLVPDPGITVSVISGWRWHLIGSPFPKTPAFGRILVSFKGQKHDSAFPCCPRHEQTHSGPRQSNIHPVLSFEEAYLTNGVVPDQGQQDDVVFFPLECSMVSMAMLTVSFFSGKLTKRFDKNINFQYHFIGYKKLILTI